jgi:hypothetical protein
MGACQSVSSSLVSVGREYMLIGSPTKTVLAAATTIATGAVVVIPLRDIQVEVSEHLVFPPEIHHTSLSPYSDRKTCLCVKVVFRGPSLLRPIGSHFECSVPPIPFLFHSRIKGQSVSPQLYFGTSLHIS